MHKATETWTTRFKERQARRRQDSAHLCYGKRCAVHMPYWDWQAAK